MSAHRHDHRHRRPEDPSQGHLDGLETTTTSPGSWSRAPSSSWIGWASRPGPGCSTWPAARASSASSRRAGAPGSPASTSPPTPFSRRVAARLQRGSTRASTRGTPRTCPTRMPASTWSPASSGRCSLRAPNGSAAELLRVSRPGGTIAMANWTKEGFIGKMFKTIARFIAPPGMPSPVLWGDEDVVRERFGAGLSELRLTRVHYRFDYPFAPAGVVDFFRAVLRTDDARVCGAGGSRSCGASRGARRSVDLPRPGHRHRPHGRRRGVSRGRRRSCLRSPAGERAGIPGAPPSRAWRCGNQIAEPVQGDEESWSRGREPAPSTSRLTSERRRDKARNAWRSSHTRRSARPA